MDRPTTILVIGNTKTGKSSLVNAITAGFVTGASKPRETFQAIHFQYMPTGDIQNITAIAKTLDDIHKINQTRREDLTKLTEKDVRETITYKSTLPILHGLTSYQIFDTAGLDDALDVKNCLFSKVVDTYIPKADIIFFVSDAVSLFNTLSEVKQYESIKKKVENEIKNGHYVELCLLVNKFDDASDKDLLEILSKVKTKYKQEKFFRFSSHKFLINIVKEKNLSLYIPDVMIKETEIILKNANVYISNGLKKELKACRTISSDNIEYSERVECNIKEILNLYDVKDTKLNCSNKCGDWDDVIGYLKHFQINSKKNIADTIQKRLGVWLIETNNTAYNSGSVDHLRWISEKYIIFKVIYDLIVNNNIGFDLFFNNIITNLFKQKDRYPDDLLLSVFQHLCNYKHNDLVSSVIFIPYNTPNFKYYVCYYMFLNINLLTKTYAQIFSDPTLYITLPLNYYDIKDNKIYTGHDHKKVTAIEFKQSWLIHNLINDTNILPSLRILLLLSITPVKTIKQYYNDRIIPKKLLNSIEPHTSARLLALVDNMLDTGKGHEILTYKLFIIKEYTREFDKYYMSFRSLRSLLKN